MIQRVTSLHHLLLVRLVIFRTRTLALTALMLCPALLADVAGASVRTEDLARNASSEESRSDASVQPVPEPGTLILVGSTLLGFAYLSRRRSSSSS